MGDTPHEFPFDEEPRTEREWRLWIAWRLARVEKDVKAIKTAVFTIAVGIIIGVGVYVLTVVVANSGGGG